MLPEYLQAQEQQMPLKDGFYRTATKKFHEKFPQVPRSDDVKKFGQEQAQDMAIKRLYGVCSASSRVTSSS
jgi:hypothetical protein